MANEITHAAGQTNGGQVASVLAGDMLVQQLFDAVDLRQLMLFVNTSGIYGSDTTDVTQDAVPGAFTAATSETDGSNVTNAAYTTSRFSLTQARYKRVYEITDLLRINDGPVQMAQVVNKLSQGLALTLTDLLCNMFPALANDVGPGTGVNLDVDSMYSAQFQLNSQSVPGPYASVLHPVQYNDFQESLRSEPGAVQFQDVTAARLALTGPGLKGSWNGYDIWQSDSVTLINTSANRSGAMFGFGCFAYTLGPVSRMLGHIPPGNVLLSAGDMLVVELERDAGNGMSSAIANSYPAAVEAEDLRGVEIISDA